MFIIASFWDQFRKPFWFVLGSKFGALDDQTVIKISSQINAKIGIKNYVPRTPEYEMPSRAGALGGLEKKRKKERKQERKKERKKII